jgi:hypothetical protein
MILYGVLKLDDRVEGRYGYARLPQGMYYLPVFVLKDEAIKCSENGKYRVFTIEGEKEDD